MERLSLPVWMLLLSVLRRRVITVQGSFVVSASKPPPSRATTGAASNPLRLSLSSSVNGDISGDDDPSNNRRPQTGWTHKQPSEDSDFWRQEPGTEKKKPSRRRQKSPPLRTGWLHNSKAPEPDESSEEKKKNMTSTGDSMARRRLERAVKEQSRDHRMTAPPTFHAAGDRVLCVTEHRIAVPVDRSAAVRAAAATAAASPGRIDVHFSIVERVDSEEKRDRLELLVREPSDRKRAQLYVEFADMETADNMILFLQGGPGFGAPVPVVTLGLSKGSSWAVSALDKYSRIVLMDQRGTGQSTPITKQTLERRFPDLFLLDNKRDPGSRTLDEFEETHPEETAAVRRAVAEATQFLAQFRADNIVLDAEEIRDALLLSPSANDDDEDEDDGTPRPWGASLGQSFGGFCQMTYLSNIDHPPRLMLFTGGIAPMLTPAFDVYSSLWERVKARSLSYYDMYPGDVAVVRRIVQKLLASPPQLPSGGTLTARRFLQLGLGLGGSPSTFASLHALFNSAFVQQQQDSDIGMDELEFSRAFLKRIDSEQSFDDHPIYFWLHETIYADGPGRNSPTQWAAHRAYEQKVETQQEFDYQRTSQSSSDQPVLFFGEMVFPWMAEDYAELRGVGLRAVVHALAEKKDWPSLYDGNQMRKVLSEGGTKAAAAVYFDDLYVDFDACMKVTARGGPLEKCKIYVTNEYQHSGLRDDGAALFAKLYGMASGAVRTPS